MSEQEKPLNDPYHEEDRCYQEMLRAEKKFEQLIDSILLELQKPPSDNAAIEETKTLMTQLKKVRKQYDTLHNQWQEATRRCRQRENNTNEE